MNTCLGFDFGTRKIGVAVGQTLTRSASPLHTLGCCRGKPDWRKISALIAEWPPHALVVGHPFETNGREASHAEAAKRFSRQLHGRFHLPVHLINECLTTRIAWSELGPAGRKNAGAVDAYAAKLILETWFGNQ